MTIIALGGFVLVVVVFKKGLKVYRVFQQPPQPKPEDDDESGIALRSQNSSNPSEESGRTEATRQNSQNNPQNNLSVTVNVAGNISNETSRTAHGAHPGNASNPRNVSSDLTKDQFALPTYEEAVESPYVPNIRYADEEDERGQPPPYSPEML